MGADEVQRDGGRGGTRGWTAASVVAALAERRDAACADCAVELIGQERVTGWMLGERQERCLVCLAARHGAAPEAFARRARELVRRLGCFRAGWVWAEREAARSGRSRPTRWPAGLELDDGDAEPAREAETGTVAAGPEPEHEFDFGDLGCGELVLDLRRRLQGLAPGTIVRILARDPGAPEDLPAWCGLTGHRLVSAAPPVYVLERRREPS